MTYEQSKEKAIAYAKRDKEMWHVLKDGSVVSDIDKHFWYRDQQAVYTADPIFIR